MIPGDLLSAYTHRQFHTLSGLLHSRAALPNSYPNALRAMQGGSLYHFYGGLWYDTAGRRTHDLLSLSLWVPFNNEVRRVRSCDCLFLCHRCNPNEEKSQMYPPRCRHHDSCGTAVFDAYVNIIIKKSGTRIQYPTLAIDPRRYFNCMSRETGLLAKQGCS